MDELDIEAAKARDESVAASKEVIRTHLVDHLLRNPDASYQSWVAVLHPENAQVTLDGRLWTDGNPWLTVWDEVSVHGASCCPRRFRAAADDSQEAMASHGGLIDLSVGALLSGTVAVATILLDGVGCSLLAVAWLSGTMARRLPRMFEPLPLSAPTSIMSAPILVQTLLQLIFLGAAGVIQLISVLFAWLLAIIQYLFMFAAGTCMLMALTTRELFAIVGLILCSIFALSPSQGLRMCGQIRKIARATHTAMCNGFCRCVAMSEEVLPTVGQRLRVSVGSAQAAMQSAWHREGGDLQEDAAAPSRAELLSTWGQQSIVKMKAAARYVFCKGVCYRCFAETSANSTYEPDVQSEDLLNVPETDVSISREATCTEAEEGPVTRAMLKLKDALPAEATLNAASSSLKSHASTALLAVGAYASDALSAGQAEQVRANDRGLPLLTESSAPPTSSQVDVGPNLETSSQAATVMELNAEVSEASGACVSGQECDTASASAFESAVEEMSNTSCDTTSDRRSGDSEQAFEAPQARDASPSSEESKDVAVATSSSQDGPQASTPMDAGQKHSKSKRPIRRGGEWKKKAQQHAREVAKDVADVRSHLSDVPNTDDGWSD
jgi:hypothetical protein